MAITTWTALDAQELVDDVQRDGRPADHVARLAAWAAQHPQKAAELLATLAMMVDPEDGLPRLAGQPGLPAEVHQAATQRAHALYDRNHHSPAIDAGERAYQRDKKRRQRLAKTSGPGTIQTEAAEAAESLARLRQRRTEAA